MSRRQIVSGLALAGAVSLVAGCGASSSGGAGGGSATAHNATAATPSSELGDSIKALGSASTLTVTAHLDTTPAAISALAAKGGSHLTPAQAGLIAHADLVIEEAVPAGKTLSSAQSAPAAATASFAFRSGGHTYLSISTVKQVIYLQGDLKGLTSLLGQSSIYDTLAERAKSLPTFVQAFLAGKPVSLPASTGKTLLGSVSGGATPPTPNAAQDKQLLTKLQTVLTKDVTTTRVSQGSTDHLRLSADGRTLSSDLVQAVAGSVPGLSMLTRAGVSKQAFNAGKLSADAYVTNGALSRLTVDVGALASKNKVSLPLDLDVARSGPAITAPAGAVPVDVSQLGSLLGALTSSGTGSA